MNRITIALGLVLAAYGATCAAQMNMNMSNDSAQEAKQQHDAAMPRTAQTQVPMAHDAMDSSKSVQKQNPQGMQGMEHTDGTQGMDGMHHMDAMDSTHNMDGMGGMSGMYGPYAMTREASGTSWQPDATPMEGIHAMNGPWMTMMHGYVDAVVDHQGGPRGASKTFAESMLMVMAQRQFGDDTVGLRAMVSLDPAMGKGGYPLLFQTGESADGRTPLVDRQHPHDLLMELAGSYSRRLGPDSSAFLYAGLPGEPALGPTAFMHRASGMDNPEAPLTHHWLDSTHISFGVLTAGYVWRGLKAEVSAFNGREPDQNRWNMEVRKLDSACARLSWNPTPEWAFQVSHGRLDSPEQLEPAIAVHRTTASASFQHAIDGHPMQTTFAWGRNRKDPGGSTNGYLLESAIKLAGDTTVFGRAESVQNDELFHEGEALHGQMFTVRKISLGVVHDFFAVGNVKFGAGALVSKYAAPAALDPIYGASPSSAMLFFRAKLAMQ